METEPTRRVEPSRQAVAEQKTLPGANLIIAADDKLVACWTIRGQRHGLPERLHRRDALPAAVRPQSASSRVATTVRSNVMEQLGLGLARFC